MKQRFPLKIVSALTLLNILSNPVTSSRRWLNPCSSGSELVGAGTYSGLAPVSNALLSRDARGLSAVQRQGVDALADLSISFRTLSDKCTSLKRLVRELKDMYVSERFRDATVVGDLERIGLKIDGMPNLRQTTTALNLATTDTLDTLRSSYETLSRLSVFLDQLRLGETLSTNERTSFTAYLQRLEDHREFGLYWLLCAIYRVLVLQQQPLDPSVLMSIQSIRVVEVDSNAMRHMRDFIVLRDMDRALEQMAVDFATLHLMQNN